MSEMIGAHKRIIPGGFLIRRKRRHPTMVQIKEAAKRAIAEFDRRSRGISHDEKRNAGGF